jgi:MYXO-CTERM domain-containing protein
MPRSSELPASPDASRLEQSLLLAMVLCAYGLGILDALLWRPGFAAYDEEAQVVLIQAWREGDPLIWRLGAGALHRAFAAACVGVLGPMEACLRLPAQLALGLELTLLYLWIKPRLGGRAALWACLADLVCSATFARSRSMLSPALLPAVFLAHAVALDHLKRPWHHALWGLSAMLWLLDYEAWALGLAWLLPAWAWRFRRDPSRTAGLGFLTGLGLGALTLLYTSPELASHWHTRTAVSTDRQPVATVLFENIRELALGGTRLPISGADGQPWPSPWIWPLLGLGAATLWRRFKGAWALLAVGLSPLVLLLTSAEPHRLSLALLALAAMAGAGASRLASERAWGPYALLGLLALGTATEIRAWQQSDPLKLNYVYGRSRDLQAAVRWMQRHEPSEGWRLLDELGSHDDASFRFLLAQAGVGIQGKAPIAIIHADFAPALIGLSGTAIAVGEHQALPHLLYLPQAGEVARLEAIRAEVSALRTQAQRLWPHQLRERALARLRDRSVNDPWTRTIYWEMWMQANMLLNNADPEPFLAAQREPLVSGWIFDAGAFAIEKAHPEQAALLRLRAEAADPRRKGLPARHLRY